MNKKKAEKPLSSTKTGIGSFISLRNFLLILFFILVWFGLGFVIWKGNFSKKTPSTSVPLLINDTSKTELPSEETNSKDADEPEPNQQEFSSLQQQVEDLKKRLKTIEHLNVQLDSCLNVTPKLIEISLLKGVLDGILPIRFLEEYVKNNFHACSRNLLNHIDTIPDIKTYTQLTEGLSVPSSTPSSLWGKIKLLFSSLFVVRKIDEDGHYVISSREDICKALQNHDLERALEVFDKLPPKENEALFPLKKQIQQRLIFEKALKNCLKDFAKG